jgi:hypothetical protein
MTTLQQSLKGTVESVTISNGITTVKISGVDYHPDARVKPFVEKIDKFPCEVTFSKTGSTLTFLQKLSATERGRSSWTPASQTSPPPAKQAAVKPSEAARQEFKIDSPAQVSKTPGPEPEKKKLTGDELRQRLIVRQTCLERAEFAIKCGFHEQMAVDEIAQKMEELMFRFEEAIFRDLC